MSILVACIILTGVFFLAVAAIGMIRFPDVFTRSHALGMTDTLGAFLVLIGLAIYQGPSLNAAKILIVLTLIFILNPVISHATVRAARRAGIKPKTNELHTISYDHIDRETRDQT